MAASDAGAAPGMAARFALVFVGVGMLVGVGGSLTAIRKFLQV